MGHVRIKTYIWSSEFGVWCTEYPSDSFRLYSQLAPGLSLLSLNSQKKKIKNVMPFLDNNS